MPITRIVKDVTTVLQAIDGADPTDKYTNDIPHQGAIPHYLSACTFYALKDTWIEVPDTITALYQDNTTQFQIDAFNTALDKIQSAGVIVVRNADFPATAKYLENLGQTNLGLSSIAIADSIVNTASYFKELSHDPNFITSLEDLRALIQSDPREQYLDHDTAG